MSLQVTGKNIQVGESFQSYVSDKLDDAIEKYIGKYLAAHVRVEKERGRFLTSCSVRVRTGLLLESTGEGTDAYSSADAAFEHLEKRLRRYKRRLKNRHYGPVADEGDGSGVMINDFVVELEDHDEDVDSKGKRSGEDAPLIIAETERALLRVPVSEAVMRLDLTEEAFLVFRNAASGEINVVYRRTDGNIGWIDATTPALDVMKGQQSSVTGAAPAQSGARMDGDARDGAMPLAEGSAGGRINPSS
jgi:ribosomal subunit interface protein